MGIEMLQKTPQAVFAVEPEYVGTKSVALLGKKSGKGSITMKLKELKMNVVLDEEEQSSLLAEIKQASIWKKGLIADHEFKEMVDFFKKG